MGTIFKMSNTRIINMNSRLFCRELRVEITCVDCPQDTSINDRDTKSCTRCARMDNNGFFVIWAACNPCKRVKMDIIRRIVIQNLRTTIFAGIVFRPNHFPCLIVKFQNQRILRHRCQTYKCRPRSPRLHHEYLHSDCHQHHACRIQGRHCP